MNQRLIIVLAVLAVLGGGLFYWRHHSHKDNANTEANDKSKTKNQHKLPTIRKKDPAESRQRMPMNQVFSFDDDPEGDMMLEGIVLDEGEQPVPGVLVSLSSNPKRFAKTGEDGTFSFDQLTELTKLALQGTAELVGHQRRAIEAAGS